jgi:hypothetical protein
MIISYFVHHHLVFLNQGKKPLAKTPPKGSRAPTGYLHFSSKNFLGKTEFCAMSLLRITMKEVRFVADCREDR